MKFEELGQKERKILLEALDISTDNMKCDLCGEPTDYKTCSIVPPLEREKKHATILCDSILCITEYLTKIESDSKR